MVITESKLRELSQLVRYFILKSTTTAGSGHPSSSLSATDLMSTLMFGGFFHAHLDKPNHPSNDRIIFSKGHAAPLLYALYAAAHQVSEADLMTLRNFQSKFEGHPTPKFPYTEAATGSLGQGLSIGLGIALANKYLDRSSSRTFVLLGDSEMAEGSNWEAVQLAAHYKTNNLIAILDMNGLGQRGPTMFGHNATEYEKRFKAFGWKTLVIDGHNYLGISSAYKSALLESNIQPTVIIAKTVKGKGVKLIENKEGWHGKTLTKEECQKAILDLGYINPSLRGVIFKPDKNVLGELKLQTVKKKIKFGIGEEIATREVYGEGLVAAFAANKNIVVLDAEVSNSTGAGVFKNEYPQRFFEMFIAEQNMVGTALGLSLRGKVPFVSTFAAFLTRAADQIRMSQYSNSNIKFVGSHCGASIGEDGSSQMGLEDIAMFRAQVEGVVLYPADAVSTVKLVGEAAKHFGNVYIRTTRKKTPVIYKESDNFKIGGSKVLKKSSSDFITVIGAGVTLYEALKAYEILQEDGISIRVIDLYSIKPIDKSTLEAAARETRGIVVVEDHYEAGGIGEAVMNALQEIPVPVYRLAVKKIPCSGKPEKLLAYEEINAAAIVKKVKSVFEKSAMMQYTTFF